MTSSMFLVLVVVLAGVFYLLFRRRGSRHSEAIKPLRSSGEPLGGTGGSDLKPFKAKAAEGKAGIPPRPTAHDSGSSHPAYPVAPAKYSGASAIRVDQSSFPESSGVSGDRLHRGSSAAMQQGAGAPLTPTDQAQVSPSAEPWYPEAPASYTDGEEPASGLHAKDPEPSR